MASPSSKVIDDDSQSTINAVLASTQLDSEFFSDDDISTRLTSL
jgi:hypothetical protein